jgi:hypothetical protein
LSKTSILVETETRKKLKQIARKDQTYDQVINDLIARGDRYNQESLPDKAEGSKIKKVREGNVGDQPLTVSKAYSETDDNICEARGCEAEPTIEIAVNVGKTGTIPLHLCNNCANKFREGPGRHINENYEERLRSPSIDDRFDDNDALLMSQQQHHHLPT